MKSVRISILTALAVGGFLAFAPLSHGQDSKDSSTSGNTPPKESPGGQRPRRPAQSNIDSIAKQLKLTDEQKTKLQPIIRDEGTKLQEVRQDASLSAEQKREKARQIREDYAAKIKPILTEEQFEQFKKMRQNAARAPRGAGGGAARQGGNNSPDKTEK